MADMIIFYQQLDILWQMVIGGILGLIFGSFMGMLAHRLPKINAQNFWQQLHAISLKGSACSQCAVPLKAYQLIPLFSFLWQKGRCPHCGQAISWRYPLMESLTALSFALIAAHAAGDIPLLIAGWLFSFFLLLIAVIDWQTQLILDNLSLPLLWLGLLWNFYFGVGIELALWGAVIGYMSLWVIYQIHFLLTQREGMGYGDFKLFAAAGAWLGALALPQIILLAALSALVIILLQRLVQKTHTSDTTYPFGPFIALGSWLTWVLGIF